MKAIKNLAAIGQVDKKDGVIAHALIFAYAIVMYIELTLIPRDGYYIYKQIAIQSLWILLLVAICLFRRQKLSSLGFDKNLVPYLAAILLTLIVFVSTAVTGNYELPVRWFFYLVAVGGLEEILFRGYAYPRIYKMWDSHVAALLITGALFGVMHHIKEIVWNSAPWYGMINEIGGGIVGNFLFLYVYARTGSIMNAILLHACMDFSRYMPWLLPLCIAYIVLIIALDMYKQRKQQPAIKE